MSDAADKVKLGESGLELSILAPEGLTTADGRRQWRAVVHLRANGVIIQLWIDQERTYDTPELALAAAVAARDALVAQIRGGVVTEEEKKALLHGAKRIREVAATRRKRCDNFDAAEYEEQARTLRRMAGEVPK